MSDNGKNSAVAYPRLYHLELHKGSSNLTATAFAVCPAARSEEEVGGTEGLDHVPRVQTRDLV